MPVLSNSVGTQKQKQGVANTGSRPVAPQQQAGGRKCRLVTREDSEQWFLECTRIKKQWGPGYKVPRQLVSIMQFDSTEERAYVVGQFDSKELVTLHSVAKLRDYVQQQQRTAGGQQRHQKRRQQPPTEKA